MMCTHLCCLYANNISYIKRKAVIYEKILEKPFQNYFEINFPTHTFRIRHNFKKLLFSYKNHEFVKKNITQPHLCSK